MSMDLDNPGDCAEWVRVVEAKTEEVNRLRSERDHHRETCVELRKELETAQSELDRCAALRAIAEEATK